MPRLSGIQLEPRAPFAEGGDGWIKDRCVGTDLALSAQRREPFAVYALDRSFPFAKKNHSAREETRSQVRAQSLEGAKETIDGAPRCAGCRLIYRDGKEASVFPVPAYSERRAVRMPLGEKAVDFGEKKVGCSKVETFVRAEHPDAG